MAIVLHFVGSSIDSIDSEAFDGMALQVGCHCMVLGILVSPNAPTPLAFLCRASEEVKLAAIVILDINL
jgi:hypothetical protein